MRKAATPSLAALVGLSVLFHTQARSAQTPSRIEVIPIRSTTPTGE